ncbi:MAG: polysaccharide biosynthesis tyrosine autokinase [Neisseria sp.]|uniref:polysaccharide biosynthesis tyrosine autokinase n=2 Tax=Neisseria sp. TaxID=192066 RepID=UPI0026DAD012|nr:polysaccharide biosynthesis tyrosine autokinase [Neisseria sp.]MDO4247990.1 polysaccharide biosynthesis tyrosine autokinase [Neisseria sp.]
MANKSHPVQQEFDLQQLAGILRHRKTQIGTAILAGAILGGLYGFVATPTYKANALIEVRGGQNQILTDVNSPVNNMQPTSANAEVDLARSRAVLGQTVDNLHLDIGIEPKKSFLGNLFSGNSAEAQAITVQTLSVPENWENTPMLLTVLDEKSYKLALPDGKEVNGRVGETVKPSADITILVSQLAAPVGSTYSITKFSKLSAIDKLSANLSVDSKGMGVPLLEFSYTGTDRQEIQSTLSHIVNNYVNLSKNRDVQIASNGLAFINEELPRLKQSLQDAENRLNAYRVRSGSVDVPTEARTAVQDLSNIETQITALKAEEAGMSAIYTKDHPDYVALTDRLRVLEQSRDNINRQISNLPNTEQEVIRLTRDVETNQATYVQLLSKQQEMNILKASSQGNVRVIDQAAAAEKPFKPQKPILVLLGALGAGILASAWYIFRALSRPTLKFSEEIKDLGYNLISSIPVSIAQSKEDARFKRSHSGKNNRPNYLLAYSHPNDIAVETLRALRTNLHFSTIDKKSPTIMITSTTPGVGKSFVSSNLAAVTAQAGQKVLLIDADMRLGTLHHTFGVPAEDGLSELLQGSINFVDAVKRTEIGNLDLITCGHSPQTPSELLMSQEFIQLLENAREKYDQIIIDTPPVLAVTDSTVIGKLSDATLLITRYNYSSADELGESYSRLRGNGIEIEGVIFNCIEKNARNYYQYQEYTPQ